MHFFPVDAGMDLHNIPWLGQCRGMADGPERVRLGSIVGIGCRCSRGVHDKDCRMGGVDADSSER